MENEKFKLITKYQQVLEFMEKEINRGKFKVGERIPSERELARRYGISHMTVNKAFSVAVANNILERKHGDGTYVVGKKLNNNIVTILSSDIKNYSLYYPLLPSALQKKGYHPIVFDISLSNLEMSIEGVLKQNPNKFVVTGGYQFPFESVKKFDIEKKMLFIDRYEFKKRLNCSYVLSDYFFGGYISVKQMAKIRKKRVGIISFELGSEELSNRKYYGGCKMAAEEEKMEICGYYDSNVMSDEQYKEILTEKDRPEGFVAFGDFRLIPVIKVIKELNLKIPEDIALIGYFNSPWAEFYNLTSVSINQEEIVKEVLYVIKEEKVIARKIQPEIVIREST